VKIGFFIFDGFPMSCLTSIIEPLRAANEISNTETFSWELISENGLRVKASADIDFKCNQSIASVEDMDALILLSSPNSQFVNEKTPNILRRLERHGVIIGAISGGVFPLARAKVGSRCRYSVHWCYAAAFKTEFPKILISNRIIEKHGRIVTASGAAASFDLALMLINENLTNSIAQEVACWFQHPIMREGSVHQVLPRLATADENIVFPYLVQRAISIMNSALDNPPNIYEIAEELKTSPRQLQRLFRVATGHNPKRYFLMLRMRAARQLVLYSSSKIKDISELFGFVNVSKFRKTYLKIFNISPDAERAQINLVMVREKALLD
jgi:transcriptional regulator GlxA family with amidase domain